MRDAEVRKILPLAADECAWFDETWALIAHAPNPLYGRLDAVCDFTSARWQDSLRFMEPNLSGVGGIHLGPLSETLVMRDVVPHVQSHDPAAHARAAARSARSVPAGAARSRARDRPAGDEHLL